MPPNTRCALNGPRTSFVTCRDTLTGGCSGGLGLSTVRRTRIVPSWFILWGASTAQHMCKLY